MPDLRYLVVFTGVNWFADGFKLGSNRKNKFFAGGRPSGEGVGMRVRGLVCRDIVAGDGATVHEDKFEAAVCGLGCDW